jgi:ubiquinone/menaquinone biosynthesis C-methylase UbiE
LDFGEFCNYHGHILDIGCGPHEVPSYINFKRNEEATYYGIDVLVGQQPKALNFTQAMGEHLPFRDELFDIAISGTSILHYVNPKAGIEEALRVIKPTGYLCIWLGVKSEEAPPPETSPDWYEALETPEGAQNPFHYKRYSAEAFEEYIGECNADIVEKQLHKVDEWRNNVFYRIKRVL